MVTDTTGASVWTADHLPFGETASETGTNNDPLLRYPGQWAVPRAEELNLPTLYYNTYRWYRPQWGRYTQADPLGLRGGMNLYEYAKGNPLRFVDKLGLFSWSCSYEGYAAFAGPGVTFFTATCESACINSWRVRAKYLIKAVGAGVGFSATPDSAGYYDLFDSTPGTPDAASLIGVFDIINISAGWDIGAGISWFRQGDGWGEWPFAAGDSYEHGGGAYAARGSSKLIWSRREKCCP